MKKIVNTVSGITAFIGFFVLMGSAGQGDYLDAIGQPWGIADVLIPAVIGLAMIGQWFLIRKVVEK